MSPRPPGRSRRRTGDDPDQEWEAEVTPTVTIYRRKPISKTWWSQRWVEAIENLGPAYASRLPRGRTYARQGRVTNLKVSPGRIGAYVEGSRPRPYRTEIELHQFSNESWARVIRVLSGRARYAARLLAGEMPGDIEAVLSAEGIHLFPRWRSDLTSRCSCPDEANPCKHVAAVHYVLARALDDDPFLLFALRGRPRDALLAMLAAGRGGGGAASAPVDLSTLTPETYWGAPQPLPPMAFHVGDPAAAGDALAELGPPPEWDGPPVDGLAREVAQAALALLAEGVEEEPP